ncbi:hypothetical protein AGMMS49593_01890 [Endomicrobiia bacterium]|nr:hypothetical protein AGMMS49593_01890 [Endomicrobiia bacterium]
MTGRRGSGSGRSGSGRSFSGNETGGYTAAEADGAGAKEYAGSDVVAEEEV